MNTQTKTCGIGYRANGQAYCAECHTQANVVDCDCSLGPECPTCNGIGFTARCENPACATGQLADLLHNDEQAEAWLAGIMQARARRAA